VSQLLPIIYLSTQVVRNAANTVIGEPVSNHHGEVRIATDLPGAERRADPRIATADYQQTNHECSISPFLQTLKANGVFAKTIFSQYRESRPN
jgi:hypothetical protein